MTDGEPLHDDREPLLIEQVGEARYLAHLPDLDYLNLLAPHRQGEVAMVIQRTPGWVLLQTKAHYPPGTFRIPTGTVRKGEAVERTLLRELKEEANLTPGSQRELFMLDYDVEGGRKRFSTIAYLVERPEGELMPVDTSERIIAWREAQVSELANVARELRRLEPPRQGWGLFRSAVHQLLAQVLSEGD